MQTDDEVAFWARRLLRGRNLDDLPEDDALRAAVAARVRPELFRLLALARSGNDRAAEDLADSTVSLHRIGRAALGALADVIEAGLGAPDPNACSNMADSWLLLRGHDQGALTALLGHANEYARAAGIELARKYLQPGDWIDQAVHSAQHDPSAFVREVARRELEEAGKRKPRG